MNLHKRLMGWMALLTALLMTGCVFSSTSNSDDGGDAATGETAAETGGDTGTDTASASDSGDTAAPAADPGTPDTPTELSTDSVQDSSMFPGFGGVTWLHHNVSGWAETARLSASVRGNSLILNYDKANVWPVGNPIGAVDLVGNAWVFFERNGRWYGGTFEWLRPGQTAKQKSSVNGGQIGRSEASGWRPQSGEVYGFMVSGFARSATRNVEERSNISFLTWP